MKQTALFSDSLTWEGFFSDHRIFLGKTEVFKQQLLFDRTVALLLFLLLYHCPVFSFNPPYIQPSGGFQTFLQLEVSYGHRNDLCLLSDFFELCKLDRISVPV